MASDSPLFPSLWPTSVVHQPHPIDVLFDQNDCAATIPPLPLPLPPTLGPRDEPWSLIPSLTSSCNSYSTNAPVDSAPLGGANPEQREFSTEDERSKEKKKKKKKKRNKKKERNPCKPLAAAPSSPIGSSAGNSVGSPSSAVESDNPLRLFDDGLQKSVRNAPPELRAMIRRRQNNESAKRCRKRRIAQMSYIRGKQEQNSAAIARIESTLSHLCDITGLVAAADAVRESQRIAAEGGGTTVIPD